MAGNGSLTPADFAWFYSLCHFYFGYCEHSCYSVPWCNITRIQGMKPAWEGHQEKYQFKTYQMKTRKGWEILWWHFEEWQMNGVITHDTTKTPLSEELAHHKLKLNLLPNRPWCDTGWRCQESSSLCTAAPQLSIALHSPEHWQLQCLLLKIAPGVNAPRQHGDSLQR